MKSIADALVYAVAFIEIRPDQTEDYLDDDVAALESIADCLANATEGEKDALAEAAVRSLNVELSSASPRPEFIEIYSTWMESLFDGWVENRRE
jgi:hypothetical protein